MADGICSFCGKRDERKFNIKRGLCHACTEYLRVYGTLVRPARPDPVCTNCGKSDDRAFNFKRMLCNACNLRLARHGDVAYRDRTTPNEVRFARAVLLDSEFGCWVWQLTLSGFGYGAFNLSGAGISAHRAAMLLFGPPMPFEGAQANHRCPAFRPDCVNPEHLYWGTPQQNMDDKARDRAEGRTRIPFDPATGVPLTLKEVAS